MTQVDDSLRLCGGFQLIHHGEEVVLGQPRLEELIALLASQPDTPYNRAQIAYSFWPDSSERQARTNTRVLLYKLKQIWPDLDEAITINRTHIHWNPNRSFVVDVHRFDQLRKDAVASQTAEERVRLLADATNAYEGDFLVECYSDWALTTREQLRSSYVELLDELLDTLIGLRQYEEALRQAKQLRDHDPLNEAAYRQLMRVYGLLGDRAAALRVFHSCASILHKELGVEPSSATQQLHAQLRQRDQTVNDRPDTPLSVERPRLVGRHAEWQQLQNGWQDALSGSAQCVIIWGEAGIGKTRLAEELIDWVTRQGYAGASSRSYAAQGALTYAPITEWLRSPRVQPSLEKVEDLWRVELARLMPELMTNRPDLPSPGPLTESWQQQRFFQSIVHALQAVPGPLLLHLDDMQWSDQETLTLLQFILYGAQTHPLLIVGTIRTEDAVENSALNAFVDTLKHNDQLSELHLGPLSPTETAELAELTAETSLTPKAAQDLYATSEGHPLFLVETLRSGLTDSATLIEENVPQSAALDAHESSSVPPKIYGLIITRLNQLSSTAQQVASLAAVIGRAFTYSVLQAAISVDESELVDALDELWTRRVIREQGTDGYDFSHDRIREVAYQEISQARRRLLHRQVAESLETLHGADLDGVVSELAAHYAQAGDSKRAFIHYHQAAKAALSQYALAQAEELFDAALAHAPDDPTIRLNLLHEQNIVFRSSLQFAEWRKSLDQQQALLADIAPRDFDYELEIAFDLSEYFTTTGAGAEAVDAALAAIKLAQSVDDKTYLARGYLELGNAYLRNAHMAEATQTYGQAARYARQAGDPIIEFKSLERQAGAGMFSGLETQEIFRLLTVLFEMAKSLGDTRYLASLDNKFGYLQVSTGMGGFDYAEKKYQCGLAIARGFGDHEMAEMILSNLGLLYTYAGDYCQAINILDEALAFGHEQPSYWRYWVAHHHFGVALMQMGCLVLAQRNLTNACKKLRKTGNHHFEVKARCDLGLAYYLSGKQQQAQDELTHALTLIESHGDLRFQALTSTRLGYVLEASDQPDAACEQYEQGRDLHDQMEQHYYAMNALAGSARVAARRGDDGMALVHARTVWQTIAGKETDATIETARTLRTCYEIFQQNSDPQAAEVLDTAWSQLSRRASTIDDPEHLENFWQLSDHHFFQNRTTTQ